MNCYDCHQSCHPKRRRGHWHFLNSLSQPRAKNNVSAEGTKIALVGSPNVGKSLIFNLLTGTYVTVSNYPGTTVELTAGKAIIAGEKVTFFDTPGMYSLLPITEEERVSRDLIMNQKMDLIIHVVEAKHLGRMLNLTLQLIETQLPVILVVNMIDEAEKLGIHLNENRLTAKLGVPVVLMSAARKVGLKQLIAQLTHYVQPTLISVTH